jgi:hypothetical protein
MADPEPKPRLRDWLWALLRVRALWPLPGVLLLLALLPFLPDQAWRPQYTTRRTLSKAELAMVLSAAGCVLYWLLLLLGSKGFLHTTRSWAMREPSDGEQALAEAGLRLVCLVLIYLAPALLIWSR